MKRPGLIGRLAGRLNLGPRPQGDLRNPAAPARLPPDGVGRIGARLRRLLAAPGRLAVFSAQGDVLEILLANEAAPQTPLLGGLSRLPLASALGRGHYRCVRLRRLRRSGTVSEGVDVTQVVLSLAEKSAGFDSDLAMFARRTPAAGEATRAALIAYTRAARRWPDLKNFLGVGRQVAQELAARHLRTLLDGHRGQPHFIIDGVVLRILLAHPDSPSLPLLASDGGRFVDMALDRGQFVSVLVQRMRADGRVTAGVEIKPTIDLLGARDGALKANMTAFAKGKGLEQAGRRIEDLTAQLDAAVRQWPDAAPFLNAIIIDPADPMAEAAEMELAVRQPAMRRLTKIMAPNAEAPPPMDDPTLWADAQTAVDRLASAMGPAGVLFIHLKGDLASLIPAPASVASRLAPLAPHVSDALAFEGSRVAVFSPEFAGGDSLWLDDRAALSRAWRTDRARTLGLLDGLLPTAEPAARPFDPPPSQGAVARRRAVMLLGAEVGGLTPLLHAVETRGDPPASAPPLDLSPALPGPPPEPRRRSVMFLHHCYYNFHYLAQALRARGWDALTVSLGDPEGPAARFAHGVDCNLYDADASAFSAKQRDFFAEQSGRFGIVHAYGQGALSLFPYNWDNRTSFDQVPWDILEWKRRGALIGYSHSGCQDLVSKRTFGSWSPGSCARCALRERPEICSDERNLSWGWKVHTLADLIALETEPMMDFKASPKAFRDPLTFALDPEVWRPDLQPPEHLVRPREEGEVVVYHAVGNYKARTLDGVNIKGTGAVMAAVERLAAEGHRVRLDFVDHLSSFENRFVQAQADIIVDQLNYGRYGATAREGMMLGKPVVGRIDMAEPDGSPPSACILETPIVDANEDTVYAVLKDLVLHPDRRVAIGAASREHAIKWWSADVLAERFERLYDVLRETGRPPLTLD